MTDPGFRPRVAVASLSGRSDADWARAAAPHVGAAFLGGVAVDDATRDAARAMVKRDREEFLPADPVAFVDEQLSALADVPIQAAVNVRAVNHGALREAASICAGHGAVLEVNAHCRQDEICAAGTGQALLRDPDGLAEQVAVAAAAGARVSVKVRTEVPGVDLPAACAAAADAGADLVHVDAMDSEARVADVVAATDAAVVANNEVRDEASVREYFAYGADAVSVGRPSVEPAVLRRVAAAVEAWFDDASRDDADDESPGETDEEASGAEVEP